MNLQSLVLWLILPVLSAAVLLAFLRLARGPDLPDRVVALDLLASIGIGIIAAYAILTGHPALLDVATVVALVSFLGSVAFAYYLERRAE